MEAAYRAVPNDFARLERPNILEPDPPLQHRHCPLLVAVPLASKHLANRSVQTIANQGQRSQ